jgi:S1-C subfamily serine protease
MTLLEKFRQQRPSSTFLILCTLGVGILIGTVLNSEWGTMNAQSRATDATPLTVPPVTNIGNEFTQLAKKLEEVWSPSAWNYRAPQGNPVCPGGQGGGQVTFRFVPDLPGPETANNPIPRAPQGPPVKLGKWFHPDKNGYIMTNNHVVENATRITVPRTNDPTEYRARGWHRP